MFMMPGAQARGGGGPDRGRIDASRLPALGRSGELAGGPAPHTAEGPGCPMARAPDSSARPGPRGTGAAEMRGRGTSAAPSFFLVSARRKWLWVSVTSARAGGAGRRAGLLAYPLHSEGRDDEVMPREVPRSPLPAHPRFASRCRALDELR